MVRISVILLTGHPVTSLSLDETPDKGWIRNAPEFVQTDFIPHTPGFGRTCQRDYSDWSLNMIGPVENSFPHLLQASEFVDGSGIIIQKTVHENSENWLQPVVTDTFSQF
jgi:hypothetical protein